MRFLCLHGAGTSSEVLEWQTAALRAKLGNSHQFEFINGFYPFRQAPEIRDIFPDGEDYWAYSDPHDPDTVIPFLDDLEAFIETEGPFDVILGFSQGAQMASTFLIHQQKKRPFNPLTSIKCAIFICGHPPWSVEDGKVSMMRSITDGGTLSLPTAHIIGKKDRFYQKSQELVRVCSSRDRIVFDHGGMHEIPRGVKVTSDMASVITKTVEMSLLLQ